MRSHQGGLFRTRSFYFFFFTSCSSSSSSSYLNGESAQIQRERGGRGGRDQDPRSLNLTVNDRASSFFFFFVCLQQQPGHKQTWSIKGQTWARGCQTTKGGVLKVGSVGIWNIAYMFLHVRRRFACSVGAYFNKISSSELSRKFIKSALLVG